jgi:alpha-1,2-glucosyltransferase
MPTFLQTWSLHATLLLTANLSLVWFNLVSKEVPEPYLVSARRRSAQNAVLMTSQDEFFHVPQAQKYCNGDYTWDPKITTPPGL